MNAEIYQHRRETLRKSIPGGDILILGNGYAARNYVDNVYPFRQDSSFLYYAGVNRPDLALLIDEEGRSTLYGPRANADDLVWFGPHPSLDELAEGVACDGRGTRAQLAEKISESMGQERPVHFLPPYRGDHTLKLAELTGLPVDQVRSSASDVLVEAVIRQRSEKSDREIEEIENALAVTAQMYAAAMSATEPGLTEAEIAAELIRPAVASNRQLAFPPIVTVRGEVLHNESWVNTLDASDMLLIDSGAESANFYASDITRTVPVNGRFEPEQRDIYEVVLAAQLAAISVASPGTTNREVHLMAARTIASGLIDLGLMRGAADEAVEAGAHALFFPHGIGHLIGLDVHDLENLGEDRVGYGEGERRSNQFGLSALRFARRLEPGFVITVEPGIYFIPALIDRWRTEGRHADFIRYDRLRAFRRFGGIRIEDDVLITDVGSRVLGPPIPKSIEDVEEAVRPLR